MISDSTRAGLKFLIYDPFKDPEKNKPNLYSWKANNSFRLKNLKPAVSIYGGVNLMADNNPFTPQFPSMTYRGMIAAQSRLTARAVFINNLIVNHITSDYMGYEFISSFQQAFRNPRWSIFPEYQGFFKGYQQANLVRSGLVYLFSKKLQADLNFGTSLDLTDERYFGGFGLSYRVDRHKDKLISDGTERPGGPIKKNAMKKKIGKKKKPKKKR